MKFHRLESHVVQSFMRDCEDGLGCIHGRGRRYGNGIRRKGVIGREVDGLAVPLVVEYDVFWTRYFFHLHKLQQVENARANLVKRESLSSLLYPFFQCSHICRYGIIEPLSEAE